MFDLAPLLYVDVERFGGKWRESKNYVKNRHTDVMRESRLTPPDVRRPFLAPVGFTEIRSGVQEFSIRTSQPLKILILLYSRSNLYIQRPPNYRSRTSYIRNYTKSDLSHIRNSASYSHLGGCRSGSHRSETHVCCNERKLWRKTYFIEQTIGTCIVRTKELRRFKQHVHMW